ncbi:MAG: OmpA family protein [Candidatus Acidiferrales bacterium]
MPEQAQRRAPEGQPNENPPNDQHALEELRSLIVAPEQEGLAEIRDRLGNLERRAEDVSSVVAEAIQMRRDAGDDRALADALGPTIEATLRDSVRQHPHVLADALFPVMGPAIRKSITETLRSMLESFNEALEHSLSLRGIQWRIEALRTGKPFAEIVLMHSLLYRVEQVFLMHRETGLVLTHVTPPHATGNDPTMVAGLLSALQSYAQDGFNASRDELLDHFGVGDFRMWVEVGPRSVIAAAFRGHPPEDYRVRMKEVLEKVEEKFGAALERFKDDPGPFRAAGDLIMPLLESRLKEADHSTKKRPYALIAAATLVVLLAGAWFAYASYHRRQWTHFAQTLRQQPGIVVTSMGKENGRYAIRGFRDPLAADPKPLLAQAGLDSNKADFQLAPYYSMDDAMVLKRANELLAPPAGATLSMKDGTLHATGVAPPKWIAMLRERAPWIAGVKDVDATQLLDAELLALNRDKAAIETIVLLFPLGSATLEAGQENALSQAAKNISDFLAEASRLNRKAQIELVGHSDSTGIEATNLPLSRQRAEKILSALIRAGIKPSNFHPLGVGTSQPLRSEDTEEGRRLNRSVTFRVAFTPASPVN